jgi:hypothetical protein
MVLAMFSSFAATLYVDVNSTNPVPPYTNWATAANVIQDAVDAASAGDTVLVTNGVYATGGRAIHGTMTNRVAVDKPLTLLSANGPQLTVIQGYQVPTNGYGDGAIRCVFLTNGAKLDGFTLAGGATRIGGRNSTQGWGGGLWCESTGAYATNCVISNCVAEYGPGGVVGGTLVNCTIVSTIGTYGGGARASILNYCLLMFNTARSYGGGAAYSTLTGCLVISNSAVTGGGATGSPMTNCLVLGNSALYEKGGAMWGPLVNCTIVGNSAGEVAGGVMHGTHYNCVIFGNEAPLHPNFHPSYTTLINCCTTPLPTSGVGNLTNAPLFLDTNNWSDLRLQSNSPCINAGNNAYTSTTNDLDGNPRIVGGAVDMGAYENTDGSTPDGIPWMWLLQYGLPTDGTVDNADDDNDRATTWQEWKAWTDPTNALSVLKLLTPQRGTNGTVVPWLSVAGHSYRLERATNGTAAFTLLQTAIAGQAGTTSFTDTTATNGESFLYRVGVLE